MSTRGRWSRRRVLVALCAIAFGAAGLVARQYRWAWRRLLIRAGLARPPVNLLRNADFAMCTNPDIPDFWGTPAPADVRDWAGLALDADDVPIAAVKAVRLTNRHPGHALALQACGTFVPEPRPYTFSVYLRADAPRRAAEIGLGWTGTRSVAVGRTWQRHTMTSTPVGEATLRYALTVQVRVREQGTLWIAAPQLEPGETATDFDVSLLDDRLPPPAPIDEDAAGPTADAARADPAPAAARSVRRTSPAIDRARRSVTRDGRPEIATGVYLARGGEWQFEDVAAHGFGVVCLTVTTAPNPGPQTLDAAAARAQLDAADRHGLRLLPVLVHDESAPAERIEHSLVNTMEALADHPALFGWLILDEPGRWWEKAGRRTREQLASLYAAAKRADPARPVFINDNFWRRGQGGYAGLEGTDIGSVDLYPLGWYRNGVELVARVARTMNRDCARVEMPSAMWLQMYGFGDAIREPTPAEERAMTYLSLIHGTRLVFFFLYKPMNARLWAGMRALHGEVRRLGGVLLDGAARSLASGVSDGVHYVVLARGGTAWVIACNATDRTAVATVDLGEVLAPRRRAARPWFDDGPRARPGRRLMARFGAFARQVFEVTEASC